MISKQTARAAIVVATLVAGSILQTAHAAPATGASKNPTHSYWTEFHQSYHGPGMWSAWFSFLQTIC